MFWLSPSIDMKKRFLKSWEAPLANFLKNIAFILLTVVKKYEIVKKKKFAARDFIFTQFDTRWWNRGIKYLGLKKKRNAKRNSILLFLPHLHVCCPII